MASKKQSSAQKKMTRLPNTGTTPRTKGNKALNSPSPRVRLGRAVLRPGK
jgi:hypothetical protein